MNEIELSVQRTVIQTVTVRVRADSEEDATQNCETLAAQKFKRGLVDSEEDMGDYQVEVVAVHD